MPRATVMPDDHSEVVPLLPIPNRTVKRLSADDIAGSRVKVGHRQAINTLKAFVELTKAFFFWIVERSCWRVFSSPIALRSSVPVVACVRRRASGSAAGSRRRSWACSSCRLSRSAGGRVRPAAPLLCPPTNPAASVRELASRLGGRGARSAAASSSGVSRFAPGAMPTTCRTRPRGAAGVVLVHGFFCNRGLWNPWMRHLRACEVPFVAVSSRARLRFDRQRMARSHRSSRSPDLQPRPASRPSIVAHSMGGLAVRAWLAAAGHRGEACIGS